MTKTLKMAVLAVVALGSVACGPSKGKACDGCTGEQQFECELVYELCKNISECKKSDVKDEYADGVCAQ